MLFRVNMLKIVNKNMSHSSINVTMTLSELWTQA